LKSGCIFCAIAAKQAFSRIVYETESIVCFFPLEPELLGHTLIVSKAHYHHVGDAPAELGVEVFSAAQVLAAHYKIKLGTGEFNLMNASGENAEQSVQHLHFHFLPRFENDGFSTWPSLPPFKTDLDALLARVKIVR
jgi:histidine triad (HIT) family protein